MRKKKEIRGNHGKSGETRENQGTFSVALKSLIGKDWIMNLTS